MEGPPGPGHGHSRPATTRQRRGDSEGEFQLHQSLKQIEHVAPGVRWISSPEYFHASSLSPSRWLENVHYSPSEREVG